MTTPTTQLGPDELQARITTAEQKVERLERLDDPGRGLSGKEAQTARERHLRDLERATNTLNGLQREWEASAPEVVEQRSQWDRIRWLGRKHIAHQLHTAEDNQLIRNSSEALATRKREREAKERLAALRERRLNPPHADAAEIVAAVMAEPDLFASCEVKLRGDDETGYINTHALEPAEIGALVVVLHLLREKGSIAIQGMSTSARWPRREPPLVPVNGLKEALLELRRERWLAFQVAGDVAHVCYGERVQEIAANWGIELPRSKAASS